MQDELLVVELPFEVPPVRVDMVWHRRAQALAAQRWLREAISEVARSWSPITAAAVDQ